MKKILLVCLVALFSVAVADAQAPKKGGKKTVTTTFVTDLDCEGCAKKINDTLPYERGVKDVKIDVPTKSVTVTYDPAKTNEEALIKAFAKVKIKAEAEGCKDGCCGDHKAPEKKECKDACCEGHDHKAEHKHDHGHGHGHNHNHGHAHQH